MTNSILLAVGLVFVIEGLLYALVPGQLKAMMKAMETMPDEALRMGGICAIGIGVFMVWVVRTFVGG
jgi:uncharacterized protein